MKSISRKAVIVSLLSLNIISSQAQWNANGNDIYNSNLGSVGIGVSSFLGTEKLRIVGDVNIAGTQVLGKTINASDIPTSSGGLSTTLWNHYTINGASTYNMNNNSGADNALTVMGNNLAIGGYQSAGTRSSLSLYNASYSYTFNHIWSAACNKLTTQNTTADKLVNTYIKSQFITSSVTNYYDLYLETCATSQPSTHWAIWQEDANAKSYMAGKVGFGTTTPAKAM